MSSFGWQPYLFKLLLRNVMKVSTRHETDRYPSHFTIFSKAERAPCFRQSNLPAVYNPRTKDSKVYRIYPLSFLSSSPSHSQRDILFFPQLYLQLILRATKLPCPLFTLILILTVKRIYPLISLPSNFYFLLVHSRYNLKISRPLIVIYPSYSTKLLNLLSKLKL